jgi:hypothetical protein
VSVSNAAGTIGVFFSGHHLPIERQMRLQQFRRSQPHPCVQREIGVIAALERRWLQLASPACPFWSRNAIIICTLYNQTTALVL